MVAKVLFRLARNGLADRVVRWCFAYLSIALPVRRVASTATVLAFHHPRPWRDTHLLLVPKASIASFLALDQEQDEFVRDVLILARTLGASLDPGVGGAISLIVNGGAYQEVGQLHFHLVAGPNVRSYSCPTQLPATPLLEVPGVVAFNHPQPIRETHVVLRSVSSSSPASAHNRIDLASIRALVETTRIVVQRRGLERTGFSLIAGAKGSELDFTCFHLVTGGEARRDVG